MSVPSINNEAKATILDDSGVDMDSVSNDVPVQTALNAIASGAQSVPWEDVGAVGDRNWEEVKPVDQTEKEKTQFMEKRREEALQREQTADKELLDSVLPNLHHQTKKMDSARLTKAMEKALDPTQILCRK